MIYGVSGCETNRRFLNQTETRRAVRHITTVYTSTDRFAIYIIIFFFLGGGLVADIYTRRLSQSKTKLFILCLLTFLYFLKDKCVLSIAKTINQESEIPL